MLYSVEYKGEKQFKDCFLKIRRKINTSHDTLQCIVKNFGSPAFDEPGLYPLILKFEGEYRALSNAWNESRLDISIHQSP